MSGEIRRLVLTGIGSPGQDDAAHILDASGVVIATIAEPDPPPASATLRDAALGAALGADFGEVVLAGVVFAPRWGGDAVGFT